MQELARPDHSNYVWDKSRQTSSGRFNPRVRRGAGTDAGGNGKFNRLRKRRAKAGRRVPVKQKLKARW